jgi:hypothetical protein
LALIDTWCNWCKKVSVAGWAWFCCDVLGMLIWYLIGPFYLQRFACCHFEVSH